MATGAAVVVSLALCLLRRMEVDGNSMSPTLLPGDQLLVVRGRRARPGELVVVADPRQPRRLHRLHRLMVKRVLRADRRGMTVLGDNPAASTDSRTFGPVARVAGRPLYRYHPPERAGWLMVTRRNVRGGSRTRYHRGRAR